MLERWMKFTLVHMALIGLIVIALGTVYKYRSHEGMLVRVGGGNEGFSDARGCDTC